MSAQPAEEREVRSAERMVFFTDAVVAIAMTLLILPLMESVSETAADQATAGEWFTEHSTQIAGFVLSFVLVASFWRGHHAIYEHVERTTPRLMWMNFAWMFTIVVLPVATAVATSFDSSDRVSVVIYVGTLIATAGVSCLVHLYVMRHPELWRPGSVVTTHGLAINLALLTMFVVALVAALLVPGVGYLAMFLIVLVGPLSALLRRRISWSPPTTDAPAGTDPDR